MIRLYGDKILREEAELVEFPNEKLAQTVLSMFLIMHNEHGVGLAANQIGLREKIAVVNIDPDMAEEERVILINPTIIKSEGEQELIEGCLSIPGLNAKVKRAAKITVENYDLEGNKYEFEADDLLAVAIQHEIDHLDGKLYVDRLGPLAKTLMDGKLKKLARTIKKNRKHKKEND